jgi:hypothetical protein
VIFAPAPDLCEVLIVEFDPKTDARPAQKVEKPDTRQTEHLSRFANGDAIVGVELEDSLLLDRANEFGFGPLVDGAVGNLDLDLRFPGSSIVKPSIAAPSAAGGLRRSMPGTSRDLQPFSRNPPIVHRAATTGLVLTQTLP